MPKKHIDKARNTHGDRDNRANQLNPNNDAYWKSRGHDEKPNDKSKASTKTKK